LAFADDVGRDRPTEDDKAAFDERLDRLLVEHPSTLSGPWTDQELLNENEPAETGSRLGVER
jgi:hypothetical protein